MKSSVFSLLLCATLLFFPKFVCADTVFTKDGDIVSGEIISISNSICILKTKYDSYAKINLAEIAGVTTDKEYFVMTAGDERIKMRLNYNTADGMKAATEYGTKLIQMSDIVAITRVVESKSNKNRSSNQKNEKEELNNAGDDKFGSDEHKQPPLEFLTDSTVLLAPGGWQIEVGAAYRQNKTTYTIPQLNQFERQSFEARRLDLSLGIRAGIMKNLEGWINVPFSHMQIREVSSNEFVRGDRSSRIGDVSAGVQYLLMTEGINHPSLSLNLSVSAPTGNKTYYEYASSWKNALSNGNGHWMLSPGISFTKTSDPAILFGGINYLYSFEKSITGYRVKPGWGVSAYLGVGFALNENLSLGSRLSYGYSSDMSVNGVTMKGSGLEPIDLSFMFSYRLTDTLVISPHLTFGLNDDAGPVNVGINLTRSF